MTQLDKDDVEAVGLVKFDFLGLKTLTVIDRAAAMIDAARPGEPPVDMGSVPTDDPETYELIRSGATTGVFQLESRGMRELVRNLKPSRFEDIVALVALFRPGPLKSGMVDDFIQRKEGLGPGDLSPPGGRAHPSGDPRGDPVSGAGDADCPRARRVQPRRRRRAAQGDGQEAPRGNGPGACRVRVGGDPSRVDAQVANSLFDLMEHFAEYGFNRAHSVSYALVSYQTACSSATIRPRSWPPR